MKEGADERQSCTSVYLDSFSIDIYYLAQSIRIVDTRGETRVYSFDGVAAEICLQCDAAQTVRALMDVPSVRERATQVVAMLNQCVEQGLMLREGKQCQSLAVAREGHSSARQWKGGEREH